MPPTTHTTALVVTAPASAAAGASEHALARAHADLEHGRGTQRRVDDPRGLDDRAFDVEELVEYAVHQALAGCLFILVENILPRKRSSLTPSTTQRRTHTHENNTSAKNNNRYPPNMVYSLVAQKQKVYRVDSAQQEGWRGTISARRQIHKHRQYTHGPRQPERTHSHRAIRYVTSNEWSTRHCLDMSRIDEITPVAN